MDSIDLQFNMWNDFDSLSLASFFLYKLGIVFIIAKSSHIDWNSFRWIQTIWSVSFRFNSVITPPLKHRISPINFPLLQIPFATIFPLSLHHIRFPNFLASAFRWIFRDTANGPFSLNRFQFQALSCYKQCTSYSSILPYTRIADLNLLDHFCIEYTPPICFPSYPPSILVALIYIITDMQF